MNHSMKEEVLITQRCLEFNQNLFMIPFQSNQFVYTAVRCLKRNRDQILGVQSESFFLNQFKNER